MSSKCCPRVHYLTLYTQLRSTSLHLARAVWVELGAYKHCTLCEERGENGKPAQPFFSARLRVNVKYMVFGLHLNFFNCSANYPYCYRGYLQQSNSNCFFNFLYSCACSLPPYSVLELLPCSLQCAYSEYSAPAILQSRLAVHLQYCTSPG